MSDLTLRLIADVAYATNGTPADALRENLRAALMNEYANGALTSGEAIEAEIGRIDVRVDAVAAGSGQADGQRDVGARLWVAIVEHTVLPGARPLLFFQAERPSQAQILERASVYLPDQDRSDKAVHLSVRGVVAQDALLADQANFAALAGAARAGALPG